MRKISFLCLMMVCSSAWSQESARRSENTDYSVYERRYLRHSRQSVEDRSGPTPGTDSSSNYSAATRGASALRSSRLYTGEGLPQATKWSSKQLEQRFAVMRDEKVVKDHEGNLKRSSWLYPDDGCFARAAVANRVAFHKLYPVPKKVFAFGNLRVATSNSPRGRVGWWYHVAPVVQVGDTKFVIDPAIESSRPLTLDEWLGRMGNPARMKVSICESGTYSPGDNCLKETDGLELRAMNTLKHFLSLEKSRLQRLGRSAEAE